MTAFPHRLRFAFREHARNRGFSLAVVTLALAIGANPAILIYVLWRNNFQGDPTIVGNIRELQNMVERAAILSTDGALPNPLGRFSHFYVAFLASFKVAFS